MKEFYTKEEDVLTYCMSLKYQDLFKWRQAHAIGVDGNLLNKESKIHPV